MTRRELGLVLLASQICSGQDQSEEPPKKTGRRFGIRNSIIWDPVGHTLEWESKTRSEGDPDVPYMKFTIDLKACTMTSGDDVRHFSELEAMQVEKAFAEVVLKYCLESDWWFRQGKGKSVPSDEPKRVRPEEQR